jgi:uncharacterized membrane protein YeaQ/YmgE (transglycosylase-associated protein family)
LNQHSLRALESLPNSMTRPKNCGKASVEEAMHFLWWILVGLVAGWATGKVMKGGGYGFFVDIILGIVGAIVGGFIARAIGFSPAGGMIYTILIATGGAILVVFVFRLITGKR